MKKESIIQQKCHKCGMDLILIDIRKEKEGLKKLLVREVEEISNIPHDVKKCKRRCNSIDGYKHLSWALSKIVNNTDDIADEELIVLARTRLLCNKVLGEGFLE